MTQDKPIQVFFSYAHEDEGLRDQLAKHLSNLERQGVISAWYDRQIRPGREWADEIDENLDKAQIILLLVSADFMASDYCYGIEMKHALEQHEAGEARVIPIILRDVDWQGAPFSKLQALPKNAEPITSWDNQDEAFADVARGIRTAIRDFKEQSVPFKSQASDAPSQIPAKEKIEDQETEPVKDDGKPSLSFKDIPLKIWVAIIGTLAVISMAVPGYFWIQNHSTPLVTTAAAIITEAPIDTEEPIVAEEPTITKGPTVTEEPIVAEEPTITEDPTVTEVPIVAEEPTITEDSTVTEEPEEPNVTLKSPNEGDHILPEIRVSGTYSNLQTGWTIHVIKQPVGSKGGKFFPEKNYFTVNGDSGSGDWKIDVSFGQGIELEEKENYNITLFVADDPYTRDILGGAVENGLDELPSTNKLIEKDTTTVTRDIFGIRIIFPYRWKTKVHINSMRTDGDKDSIQELFSTEQKKQTETYKLAKVKLSSDGTKIAFISRNKENADLGAIYLRDLKSGVEQDIVIAPDIGTNYTSLAWSPDDRYIVYSIRYENDKKWKLGLYNVQNKEKVQLMDDLFGEDPDPSWIDTSTILYTDRIITTTASYGFMSIDIDTHETNIFFNKVENEYQGVVSPDGKFIAYQVRLADFNTEIYVADLENPESDPRRIVETKELPKYPLWDPNGETIYYLSFGSIYTINISGNNREMVFSPDENNTLPVWNMDVGQMYIEE